MITLTDYWMGRDARYKADLTSNIVKNAGDLLLRVNRLIEYLGVALETHPISGSCITSGWRPPSLNAATPNAAPRSKHMTGQAIDLYDPEGDLDEWCLQNPIRLAEFILWQEHPSATKGWCHLQSVPPKSGNRVFYP